ncbi:hypothetical protein IX307_000177 [Bacteroides pyogenes]|nr:hypothetical protein [Bacteroides pyogenes]MBR8724981.1 hypothetical protein [Bacteroides pyogenes]MBR8738543.1 hypothetical protein [Bacteroides pyogenes]MBR8754215.1 hypothetical protein [Bacteroides pyogenes]MBR8785878.1 hypothetical protein [Bacteroides pyogenes]
MNNHTYALNLRSRIKDSPDMIAAGQAKHGGREHRTIHRA